MTNVVKTAKMLGTKSSRYKESAGWKTTETETIDWNWEFDWAAWIGDYEAIEFAEPGSMAVPDYKSVNSMKKESTSSGLTALGTLGRIGAGGMFLISTINSAAAHYSTESYQMVCSIMTNEMHKGMVDTLTPVKTCSTSVKVLSWLRK